MPAELAAWTLSILTGWLLAATLWPARPRRPAEWLLQASVGAALGLWLSSLLYFAALHLGWTGRAQLLALDAAALAAMAGVWRRRAPPAGADRSLPAAPPIAPAPLLRLALGLAGAAGLAGAVVRQLDVPLGVWDAWAIWNLKARFFALQGGEHWTRAFSERIAWSSPEYPLLLPLNVARAWSYAGSDGFADPGALSIGFALIAALLLWSALATCKGTPAACLGTLALLATGGFLGQASAQIADIPLACFLLAALAMRGVASSADGAAPRAWALAGLCAGAAAWTKYEGILTALAFLTVAAVPLGRRGGPRRAGAIALAGAAVPLACLLYLKLAFAPPSDLVAGLAPGAVAKLIDWERHRAVLASFGAVAREVVGLPLLALLLLLAASLGVAASPRERGAALGAAAVLLLVVLAYYGVYLLTPLDLEWHLVNSNARLLIQLWPAALLALFSSLRFAE
jgi:hypothetical protein